MASTSPFGGYKRIQFSGDTAANFEKYNPACRPYEPIAVRKANGHVCVKMNCTDTDKPYNEIPVIWDQDVAERLESDLSESQKAASDAKQSETNAKEYAKDAAGAVDRINAKELLCTVEGMFLRLDVKTGRVQIGAQIGEEGENG